MGGAIGARLAETGTELIVYDRDPEKIADLVAQRVPSQPRRQRMRQARRRP